MNMTFFHRRHQRARPSSTGIVYQGHANSICLGAFDERWRSDSLKMRVSTSIVFFLLGMRSFRQSDAVASQS